MSLLPGGGYSEFVAVHKDHLIEIPENITSEDVINFVDFNRQEVFQKYF